MTCGNAGHPSFWFKLTPESPLLQRSILLDGPAHLGDVGTGVGGSGRYAHVSGVVTMVAAPDGSSTALTFDIRTNK